MRKRLDVSTLTLSVKPVTDHSGIIARTINAAILRVWLFLNTLALLRNAQRQVDKITDDNTTISVQMAMRTRLNKPVQPATKPVTQATGPIVSMPVWATQDKTS